MNKFFIIVVVLALLSIGLASASTLELQLNISKGSGNSINDTSGNSRTFYNSGGSWLTNYPSYNTTGSSSPYSLNFTGGSDEEVQNLSVSFPSSTAWSVSAWVWINAYKSGASNNRDYFFDAWDNSDSNERILLALNNGAAPNGDIDVYDFDTGFQEVSTTKINTNEWVHLVATVNGSNFRFYVNGDQYGNTVGIVNKNLGVLDNWSFFGSATSTQDTVNGAIDQIAIYSEALHPDNITTLYNYGAAYYVAPAPAPSNYSWVAPSNINNVFYQEYANSSLWYFQSNGTYRSRTNESYFYANYTKPYGANMAYWQIKHGNLSTYNISLRDKNCWSDASETVQLRFYSYAEVMIGTDTVDGWPECYNTSNEWTLIGQNSSNNASTGVTITADLLCSYNASGNMSDGKYNTYCSSAETGGSQGIQWTKCTGDCNASYLYEEGLWWNVSMVDVNWSYYDQETNTSLYNTTNVTIYANSPQNHFTNTNDSGNYYKDELGRNNYTITFTGDGYAQQIKYWYYPTTIKEFMSNYTYNAVVQYPLYLLGLGSSSDVLVTVYQGIGDELTEAVVSAQKWNLGTNSYTEVEDCITDSNGQCLLHLELLNTTYRFVISKEGNILFTSKDQKIYSTSLSFTFSTTSNTLATISKNFGATGVTSYDNTTAEAAFSWVDNDAALGGGCIKIDGHTGGRTTTVHQECSTNITGTIAVTANASNYDRLEITGWVYDTNAVELVMDTTTIDNSGIATSTGLSGLFLFGFIILGVVFFVGLWSPAAAIIMGVGFLFAISFLGFISLGALVIGPLMAVAIIVAWRLQS